MLFAINLLHLGRRQPRTGVLPGASEDGRRFVPVAVATADDVRSVTVSGAGLGLLTRYTY